MILQYATSTATDPCIHDVIIDAGGTRDNFQIGHSPTLTRSRAGSFGSWALRLGRPLRLSELFRLQGLCPETKVVNISANAMAACLGNSFSLLVIERVLRAAIFAAEHSEAPV
eukprot:GHVR01187519.1.p1 GENE.GHVR01187519.1~~GHVR01187519.1.p1  ORF type:complete len:113 (-),score=12.03 GHVR01187519.1:258-596(-)